MLHLEVSASAGVALQLQFPTVPGKLITILDTEGKVTGVVGVLKFKQVDTSVYDKPRNRLRASKVLINRKRLTHPIRAGESAVKNARVHGRSTDESSSSTGQRSRTKIL